MHAQVLPRVHSVSVAPDHQIKLQPADRLAVSRAQVGRPRDGVPIVKQDRVVDHSQAPLQSRALERQVESRGGRDARNRLECSTAPSLAPHPAHA